MVELYHVHRRVHAVVGQHIVRHHVCPDGPGSKAVQDIRLFPCKGLNLTALKGSPCGAQGRVTPFRGTRRFDFLKGGIGERPTGHSPMAVERIDCSEPFPQEIAERRAALRAEAPALIGEQLIVNLPSNHLGVMPETLCQRFDNGAVFLPHQGRGSADMVAGGDDLARPIRPHAGDLGVFCKHPPRRRGGRRTEQNRNSRLPQAVDDILQPIKIKFLLAGLQLLPCEFSHAQQVDTVFTATRDIPFDFLPLPEFRIVCSSDVHKRPPCKMLPLL